ncbi:MAG TPA: PKD domain-containing protein [Ohtaekwangia sp.]|nr:PKD domain-containing protein [Ohtaekwangia sp.]
MNVLLTVVEIKMKRTLCFFIVLFVAVIVWSCYEEEGIPVNVEFSYTVMEDKSTAPASISITNATSGADFYLWTFIGATPPSSDDKDPGTIVYHKAGTYTITLEAWNDMERSSKAITIRLDSAVKLDFTTEIMVNAFAPATVRITNNAPIDLPHEWVFTGGVPATSNLVHPPDVVFQTPGDHKIILKVLNGDSVLTSSQTVTVSPSLNPAFTITPGFDDLDMEAPLEATLFNQTVSGINYTWTSSGGIIQNPKEASTTIQFDSPGSYTVTLEASNGKETKSVTHPITVKPNTNLYTISNVRFGVSAAHNTIGCFYAASVRDIIATDEVNTANGGSVNLVFYAINASFSYCKFISPDAAPEFGFSRIPTASPTWFVNVMENSTLVFSEDIFNGMMTDEPLKSLDIKGNETGAAHFTNSTSPRIVMFETGDGRKGAILIKDFVSDGMQSYVVADIKIQKARS